MGKFSLKKSLLHKIYLTYLIDFILIIYSSDNPEVDIKGANLFTMSLNKNRAKNTEAPNLLQIESVLVCTGVYKEGFGDVSGLMRADTIVYDILDVVNHIIKNQN